MTTKIKLTNKVLREKNGILKGQITILTKVLMEEFSGPEFGGQGKDETAVEMAVRVLREQKEKLSVQSH